MSEFFSVRVKTSYILTLCIALLGQGVTALIRIEHLSTQIEAQSHQIEDLKYEIRHGDHGG